MKPLWKNILIPTSSAALGGLLVIGALFYSPTLQSKILTVNDEVSNRQEDSFDPIFDSVFEEHGDLRKRFESLWKDNYFFNETGPLENFEALYGKTGDISKREDASHIYYDIPVESPNSTSVNTEIENGYLTILGSTKKNTDAGNGDSIGHLKSSFRRTFPLPDDIDHRKMEMFHENGKVVIKFPKLKV